VESAATVQQILAGARRALGAVERVQSLSAIAAVTGPRGSFEAAAYSARDGRARLALGKQFLAGIGAKQSWVFDPTADTVGRLDSVTRSVVRGHELHMLVLAPETRWQQPQVGENREWAGAPAVAVVFRDDLGGPATLYLRASDTLPLGLGLINQTGEGAREVDVTFGEWEEVDGVRLFRRAVFVHGPDRYVYSYTQLRLNAVPDSVFEAPSRRPG
jgi:hypothetical protein